MGSVESYETARGRRYRARWRDPETRRSVEQAGFTTKRAAEDHLANVTVSAARGEYVDPRAAKVTIAELGVEWLASRTSLKPSSLRPLEIAWRIHVEPRWGARRVGEIRHSQVQTWITEMTAQKGATTVLRAHGILAGILDVAVRDRRISTNPARGVSLPRKVRKPRAYLTPQQVDLLAQNAGEHATLITFLAYTGVRWGEATAIRVRHVNALRRRISIEENAVKVGAAIVTGTPKTHESRTVPLPTFLVEDIARACEGKPREALVFGDGVTHVRAGYGRHPWIQTAVEACQAVDPTFPRITLHDLRHTAASIAVSAGANVKVVQRMLGHKSAAMTLDTYADLFDDDLDAISDALDSVRALRVVGDSWGKAAADKR